jgi:hypothetical protein
MPLSDLQTALGIMVTTKAVAMDNYAETPNFDNLRLTTSERDWLTQLAHTPGFNVTCYIQRWWRETKLSWTARLTMAALGPELTTEAIKGYLKATPCPSLFFTPEALGFLDYVLNGANSDFTMRPHLAEIARFERALLIAKEAAQQSAFGQAVEPESRSEALISLHPAAALLEFSTPPEELLGALVEGRPLPPASNTLYPVLVAPGLAYLWRPASADESNLFTCCRKSTSINELRLSIPDLTPTLNRLLSVCALQSNWQIL